MVPEGMRTYYVYLEKLRRSGEVNMFGAAPYLANEFGLKICEARSILCKWMDDYDYEDYKNI